MVGEGDRREGRAGAGGVVPVGARPGRAPAVRRDARVLGEPRGEADGAGRGVAGVLRGGGAGDVVHVVREAGGLAEDRRGPREGGGGRGGGGGGAAGGGGGGGAGVAERAAARGGARAARPRDRGDGRARVRAGDGRRRAGVGRGEPVVRGAEGGGGARRGAGGVGAAGGGGTRGPAVAAGGRRDAAGAGGGVGTGRVLDVGTEGAFLVWTSAGTIGGSGAWRRRGDAACGDARGGDDRYEGGPARGVRRCGRGGCVRVEGDVGARRGDVRVGGAPDLGGDERRRIRRRGAGSSAWGCCSMRRGRTRTRCGATGRGSGAWRGWGCWRTGGDDRYGRWWTRR